MDSKICKTCGVEKEITEFSENKTGHKGSCKICLRDRMRAYSRKSYNKLKDDPNAAFHLYKEANKEKTAKYNAQWHQENKERRTADYKAAYAAKPEVFAARSLRWRTENKEKTAATALVWKRSNKGKVCHYATKYKAAKLRAIPKWADMEKIDSFYISSEAMGMLIGEWYEVDHIVPLQSEFVCGLHCEYNLQVLPKAANASKGNRYWPDMW